VVAGHFLLEVHLLHQRHVAAARDMGQPAAGAIGAGSEHIVAVHDRGAAVRGAVGRRLVLPQVFAVLERHAENAARRELHDLPRARDVRQNGRRVVGAFLDARALPNRFARHLVQRDERAFGTARRDDDHVAGN